MIKNAVAFVLIASGGLLAASSARAVTLVHTNDVLGELEPCGCRNDPLGGMARKANLLKKLAPKSNDDVIQVDAGDLLFPTETIPEMLVDQSKLQAAYLLQSMDQLHHDVVVPGEKDFALGVKTFDELRKKSKIHFLAANLRKKGGGKAFESHLILKRKSSDGKTIRVAILGLVGEDLAWPKELKAAPAIAVAKAEVAALRKQADVIVAVTHEGLEKDEALAKAVPGIDVIVGGHSQSFLQEPTVVGSTLILQSSFRNQYVGSLPLTKPMKADGYQLTALDPGYESPEGQPSETDTTVKSFKAGVAALNTREDARLQADSAKGFANEIKFQTFPRCAECHLKQFDFWRQTHHAQALAALIEKDQYQNKECLSCHTVGLGDKQGFSSVNRLAEIRPEAMPKPADDFSSPQPTASSAPPSSVLATADYNAYLKLLHDAASLDTPVKVRPGDKDAIPLQRSLNLIHNAWAPVQCENCHQPGEGHPFSGVAYPKKVETTTCLKCHTAERAPDWYAKDGKLDPKVVEKKRAQVTCPAGE